MGRKSKFTTNEKLEYVLRCIDREDSINHTAKLIGVNRRTLSDWIRNYQSLGIDGLNITFKNTSYSEKTKNMSVRDYIDGKGSLDDICKKYGIRSTRQLRNWIMKYNSHERLKSYGTGGVSIMTKGRETNFDERVRIVEYCIEHDQNYSETSQKFQVSYQQVYSWTNKYLKDGVNALQDRRGRKKTKDSMSEVEKLKAQNKLLQAENRRKQMEIDFLKKLLLSRKNPQKREGKSITSE